MMATTLHRHNQHSCPIAMLQRSLSCPASISTSRPQITVKRDHQYTRCSDSNTVHLKGFASRVNNNDPHTIAMGQLLLKQLTALQPARIVWDGDNFSNDSFTRLIPQIYSQLGSAVELVAFLRECDQERFAQSWKPSELPVSLYLCPSALDWQKLGTHALEVTGAQMVMCYGGGGTVADEFAAKPSAEVKFSMFAISRPTSDGSSTEHASLVGKSNASLEVFEDAGV